VKLSIPHRYRFGRALDLGSRAGWDELRFGDDSGFALGDDRDAWLRLAAAPAVVARARALDAVIGAPRAVASYGVGTGVTERALYEFAPERRLVCTEFAPRTAQRLAELFPEATVVEHDVREGPIAGVDLHLFFRIDTELDDAGFKSVLQRFRSERVMVVATELLGARSVVREGVTWLRGGAVRAGRVRTRAAFEALFEATHAHRAVQVADLSGWVLEPTATTG